MVLKGCSHKCADHEDKEKNIRGGTSNQVELYEKFSTNKIGTRDRTKLKR